MKWNVSIADTLTYKSGDAIFVYFNGLHANIFICSVAVYLHSPFLSYISPLDSPAVERIVISSNLINEGQSFNMTCVTSGYPEPNVYWIKGNNGARINGSVLTFTNINRNDSGQYRCEAKNDCGSNSSVQSIEVFCKYETTLALFLFFLVEADKCFFFQWINNILVPWLVITHSKLKCVFPNL